MEMLVDTGRNLRSYSVVIEDEGGCIHCKEAAGISLDALRVRDPGICD